ncbi:MAG: response regulator transcription factor [Clostridiales bacterium]|nr:response regulator transcription factor [Clostridiales bacterium]MDO5140223.1 response regulator transcription factor [Eubacteriales bacterium]
MTTVLIADDNRQLVNILKAAVLNEGYSAITAYNGNEALESFFRFRPGIILLDVMMPGPDGFQVCREIRKESDVPIIMITARGEDFEKIMGLEIGADDYIVKPFSPGEVIARIRAVMRRIEKSTNPGEHSLCVKDLSINLSNYRVMIGDTRINLTKRETDMLWTLANGRFRAYSREMLLDMLWGYDYCGDPRTVDSHIKRLRAKLDSVPHPAWDIRTIRNVGYKFEVNSEK